MADFLKFMDELSNRFRFHMEIYYSHIMDWCITVYKQGCATDYPNSPTINDDKDALMCNVQDSDMELCFAKAHVAVKEWMLANNNGY